MSGATREIFARPLDPLNLSGVMGGQRVAQTASDFGDPTQASATPQGAGFGMSMAQTSAALSRQQWNEYLTKFIPIENMLIKYASDPNVVTNAVTEARGDVAQSFEAQEGITERKLSGMGLELDSAEKQAMDRATGIQRSLADVSAANMTTQRVGDRQRALMGSPAPNLNLTQGTA